MRRKLITVFVLILVAYVASYAWFRSYHVEIWDHDGQDYLIFPKGNILVYYFYRPLTYIDGSLTHMRFHIGPHQESSPAPQPQAQPRAAVDGRRGSPK